jgi:cytochrome c biogenesis protein CcdA
MKINDETIPKDTQNKAIVYVILAVLAALIFFGLLNVAVTIFTSLLNLIIKYWFYAAAVVVGFLILRKFLKRKKK